MSSTYFKDIYTTALDVFQQRGIKTPDKPDADFASHVVQAVGARHLGFDPVMIEGLDRKLTLALEPNNKLPWSGKNILEKINDVSSVVDQAAQRTQPDFPTPLQSTKAALFTISRVPHPPR